MRFLRSLLIVVASLLVALPSLGCTQPSRDAPIRSPTLDYRPPPPQTSDGKVVGVDNKAPEDHLGEGPAGDRLAPGWDISPRGLRYDPKKRTGGALQGPGKEPPSGSGPR